MKQKPWERIGNASRMRFWLVKVRHCLCASLRSILERYGKKSSTVLKMLEAQHQ